MGIAAEKDQSVQPIEFGPRKDVEKPAEPSLNFDDLTSDEKLGMLDALKASLLAAKEGSGSSANDISPLMANIEKLVRGEIVEDKSGEAFGNNLDLARANLRDQMGQINPDMYPACDARLSIKVPKSAKKHLMKKALEQDLTLSEYVIQALNIVGELEGDDMLVLVAPRGHFLQQASKDRANRS